MIASFFRNPSGRPVEATALLVLTSRACFSPATILLSLSRSHVSRGCIRLLNADVIDLYNRVGIGTTVVVLPNDHGQASIDDGRRVAIQENTSGPMTAPYSRNRAAGCRTLSSDARA